MTIDNKFQIKPNKLKRAMTTLGLAATLAVVGCNYDQPRITSRTLKDGIEIVDNRFEKYNVKPGPYVPKESLNLWESVSYFDFGSDDTLDKVIVHGRYGPITFENNALYPDWDNRFKEIRKQMDTIGH